MRAVSGVGFDSSFNKKVPYDYEYRVSFDLFVKKFYLTIYLLLKFLVLMGFQYFLVYSYPVQFFLDWLN